jgi:hypothetical protein
MTPLESSKSFYKEKGYLDPEKLFKVLEEHSRRLKQLEEHPAVSIPPLTEYFPSEAH